MGSYLLYHMKKVYDMSVLYARLKNKCRSLISYLLRIHIRNNPLCDLGGVVDYVTHFFMKDQFSMIQ